MHPENLHSPPYRTLSDEQQSRKPIRKKWKSNEARAAQQREKSGQRWECPKILWKRLDKLSDTPRRFPKKLVEAVQPLTGDQLYPPFEIGN